jgi:hypothetical protein
MTTPEQRIIKDPVPITMNLEREDKTWLLAKGQAEGVSMGTLIRKFIREAKAREEHERQTQIKA